jgi:hypothetical protein
MNSVTNGYARNPAGLATPSPAPRPVVTPPALRPLSKSVQQFFGAINWDNQPLQVQQLRQSVIETASAAALLDPKLPVKQFFAAINWEGLAALPVVVPPSQDPEPAKSDSLTLDDFSSLF